MKDFDLPIINRPSDPPRVTGKMMESLIEESKTGAFDVVGVYLTPEAAQALLAINTQNRPLTERNVERLKDQIERGQWGTSNDMIVVSSGETPYLLNGQNRCNACIETGVPILVDLRFGADPLTFLQMDKGKKRTLADDLFVYSTQKNYNKIASHSTEISRSVRYLIQYFERDKDFKSEVASEYLIKRAVEQFAPCVNFLDDAKAMRRVWRGSLHEYMAVRYLMSISDENQARDFWRKVVTQENLAANSPEMRIVRRFQHIKGFQSPHEHAAVLIIGFNQKIGASDIGRNTLIEYARYSPSDYPAILHPDGSEVRVQDIPQLQKATLRAVAA